MNQEKLSAIFDAIREIEKIAGNAELTVEIGGWAADRRGHGDEMVDILTRTDVHEIWERDSPDGDWNKL